MAAPTPQPTPTSPYNGLTFLQMQTMAADWFGETTTTLSAAELARIKALLNEAVARINFLCPGLVHIRKYYTVTTTKDQASYALPVGITQIHDPIVLDDEPVYSIPTTYQNRTVAANVATTDLNVVRMYAADWGVDDAAATARPKAILTFYPAPGVNGTAEIWGTGEDNALAADGDLARIPYAYSSTPVYHAVRPLLALRGRTNDLKTVEALWANDIGEIKALGLRQRTRGVTIQIPNLVRSGRGTRYPGTYRKVP